MALGPSVRTESKHRVFTVDPSFDPRWDSFVRSCSGASFYHLAGWHRVISRCYGFQPIYLAASDDACEFSGVLPLFLVSSRLMGSKLVSLPFSDVSGPVAVDDGALKSLIDYAIDLCDRTGAKYVQLRSVRCDLDAIDPRLSSDSRYVDFVLRLSQNADNVWSKPTLGKVRGHVRKAYKTGIAVRVGESEADLVDFFHLHLATTKKHGMPAQSFHYFKTLWHELIKTCRLRLLLATCQGRSVAASLFVGFGDTLHYLYNASDRDSLNLAPNDLLLWEAIAWSCEQGYRRFSFGKTSLGNAGLVAFKRGWGAEAVPLRYYYYPGVQGLTSTGYDENSTKYRLITTLWRVLPAGLTNRLGGVLYKHLA